MEYITANYDSNISGNMGSAGKIPITSILTWMNDLTHILTCSYPWRHQLLHTIGYRTSYITCSFKSTCDFKPATLILSPKPAE